MEHPLYTLRASLGATQKKMALKLGVTPGRISQIENESARIGSKLLIKLFETYPRELARLGITPLDILNGKRG